MHGEVIRSAAVAGDVDVAARCEDPQNVIRIRVDRIARRIDYRRFVGEVSGQRYTSACDGKLRVTGGGAAGRDRDRKIGIDCRYRLSFSVAPRTVKRRYITANVQRRR